MKKSLIAIALLCSFSAGAEDRPEAPAELIADLKAYCQEIADEDGVESKNLKQFLLDCVNEELESEGYRPVKSLD